MGQRAKEGAMLNHHDIRELRTRLRASEAELALEAGVAPPMVQRIEGGESCQEETKRKVILALGKLAKKRFLHGA